MKYFEDYIKSLATNQKVLARVEKVSERKQAKSGNWYYSVRWILPSTNEVFNSALYEDTIKFNLKSQPPKEGETLSVFLNGKGFVTYRRDDMLIDNRKTVDNEGTITKMKQDEEEDSVINRIVCTYIAAAMTGGKTPSEAGGLAVTAYFEQQKAVEKIKDRKNAPAISHSEEKLEEVNDFYGTEVEESTDPSENLPF